MKFTGKSTVEGNAKWNNCISRQTPIYMRDNDVRSPFNRDYTRVIHSTAYRRLKHKTQVFFSPSSDHVCTRIEHVSLVESISYTIAHNLGLNTELTKVISVAHDLGHSPFGHHGESILNLLSRKYLGREFWHEQNGLIFVDHLENLSDDKADIMPLNLTYAVRDGIISHCGEVMENGLFPREEFIDLHKITQKNSHMPYTWEGCVVKLSDTISYIGRDIEDAIRTNILSFADIKELGLLINNSSDKNSGSAIINDSGNNCVNNGVIIHQLITDLCSNSSPKIGLCFSENAYEFLAKLKQFNTQNIYKSPYMTPSHNYITLVLNTIFDALFSAVDDNGGFDKLVKLKRYYPHLASRFLEYITIFLGHDELLDSLGLSHKERYVMGIIYYICGMTDNYAIEVFDDIVRF